MTLLIKNALCFIADEFKKSDVFITDGIITEISSTISSNGADRVIDALDKYFLIPGFVDVHTHLRQPGFSYKETIRNKVKVQGKFIRQSGGRGQYGDVWFEMEPLEPGKGIEFESKIVGVAVP